MVKKLARQNIVKEFLTTRIISSQEQLMQLLKAEGVRVTQATLSRDFAELGVVRTFNDYGVRYVLSADESGQQLSKLIGLEIMRVDNNENMILRLVIAPIVKGMWLRSKHIWCKIYIQCFLDESIVISTFRALCIHSLNE